MRLALISLFVAAGIAIGWLARPDLGGGLPGVTSRATEIPGAGAFPIELRDPSGRSQALAAPPRRIVSSTLASDELLFRLVDPLHIAGVTPLVDDPALTPVAGQVPPTIPRVPANAEAVLSLEPELLIVANYTRAEAVELLYGAGIPLLRLGTTRSLGDVFATIRRLAKATGGDADALLEELATRVDAVEQAVPPGPRPRVLYLAGANYTAGPGSLIDDLLTRAGAINCAGEAGLRESSPISTELAIALQPDVIIVTGWEALGRDETPGGVRSDPRWRGVPAVAEGRVHVLPSALMLSVSHFAVDALEAIAAVLHPDVSKSARGGHAVRVEAMTTELRGPAR